jgi:hypothetical protein
VQAIFNQLARNAGHPKAKGCGFLRTSAELANLPGHPAIKIGAAHKKKFEAWLHATFEEAAGGEEISPAIATCVPLPVASPLSAGIPGTGNLRPQPAAEMLSPCTSMTRPDRNRTHCRSGNKPIDGT